MNVGVAESVDRQSAGDTPAARTVTGSSVARLVLAVGIAGGVVVLALTHWSTVRAGSRIFTGADARWLVLAGIAAASIWISGTVTQLGAMSVRAPFGRLLAVQVAGSFANHVLPAGSGGIGINIRFQRRHGIGLAAAARSVGLNSVAGLATHLLLLVAAVVISPSVAHDIHVPGSWRGVVNATVAGWTIAGLGGVVLTALLVASLRAGWRQWVAAHAVGAARRLLVEVRGLRSVLRDPARAAALWLGSLSTPLLHGLILFAVLRSVGVHAGLGTTVVVYLIVSSLSAMVPSPGGLGALDVTLAAGLAAVGVSSAVALGAVLGYRLITVWLPLLPSALVLAVLVRRRII
jgi:uncharacterized membrane protein YbhN (UPF0104 family)